MRRNNIRFCLASIVGVATLAGVGCTENRSYRGFDDPADLHADLSWAPYTAEYDANTGVTGSSASPYVGGGVINQKPDPMPPGRIYTETRTYTTTPSTTIYTSPAPAHPATGTTVIRRDRVLDVDRDRDVDVDVDLDVDD